MQSIAAQQYFILACEFIEVAKRATIEEELVKEFALALAKFGFDRFSCASLCDVNDPPDNAVMILEYPEAWLDRYTDQRYQRFDKILELSLSQTSPFSWADPLVERHSTDVQRQIFNEAGEAGLIQGLTVPVHSHGFLPACVNIVGPEKDTPAEAGHALHLMSLYFYEAATRIRGKIKETRTRTVTRLTPRERECLQWASEGKSDTIIAELLGIPARTVHHHIEVSKRKFGVATRTQAAVRAYAEHQIVLQ